MPTPLHVHFHIPDGEFPMVPDKETDEAKAMATVNTDMEVEVNMTATLLPLFVEGASHVVLIEGENMPFSHVTWSAMQSMVVTTGAQFMATPVLIGANQVPMQIGEPVIVTCGPFECAESAMAPEITIANSEACTGWEASVELQMGLVDNDVVESGDATTDTMYDGIDLGWVTSSNLAMTVKHSISGVSGAVNQTVPTDAKKGDDMSLAMKNVSGGIRVDVAADDTATPPVVAAVECVPATADATNTAQGARGYPTAMRDGIFRPANCFRLVGSGAAGKATAKTRGPDYLSGYTLELVPKGAGVDWGSKVEWENDPFEDLTCDSMMVDVADHLDVCSLFSAEVAEVAGKDWEFTVNWDTTDTTNHRVEMWTLGPDGGASAMRFSTLWFDDDLDGKIKNANVDRPSGAGQMHDLYDNNATGGDDTDAARLNLEVVWQLMTNNDGTPNRGDFGKVDLLSDEDDDDTDADETAVPGNPDGNADNYPGTTRGFRDTRKCSDDDGEGCDAKWSETFDIAVADGTFGCTDTISMTVSCEWDAQGEMGQARAAAATALDTTSGAPANNAVARFMKCEVE
ncbi:MAG: hypothetical protein OYL41_13850 [Acidobacteriota bacterium]|nr:hypothetical protein [Acidobacteriota bacterium]